MRLFRLFIFVLFLAGGFSSFAQSGDDEIDLRNEPVYTSLSKALRNVEKVYKLNLSNEKLKEFPEDILKLKQLRYLTLDSNQISGIPAGIAELQKLTYFSISNNALTELPANIGQLNSLQYLYLDHNSISALPVEFFKLANLKELFVNSNKLTEIPKEVKVLKELKRLVAADNKLTTLPDEIGYVYNLRKLSLSKNQINALPEHFFELTNLTGLYLSENKLEKIDPKINKLNKLEILGLDGNQLHSLPGSLGELVELKHLYLEENLLDSLPKEMSELFKLTELYIGDNPISKIPVEYNRLSNLTTLNIQNLVLKPFPQVLYDLQNKGTKITGLTTNELYNAKVLLSSARNKKLTENYPEAIKKYEQLIALDTNNVIAMSELAFVYLASSEYDKAAAICQRALTKNASQKTLEEVRTTLSNSLNRTNQTDLTVNKYEEKMKAEPSNADPIFSLGKFYFDQQKFDDAKRVFLKAVKTDPSHAESHFYLAIIYLKEDQNELFAFSALRLFELAPTSKKTATTFPFLLGRMKMKSGMTVKNGTTSYFDSYIIRNENNQIVYKSESPMTDLLIAMTADVLKTSKGTWSGDSTVSKEDAEDLVDAVSEQVFYKNKTNTEIFQVELANFCKKETKDLKEKDKAIWDYYQPFYDAIIKSEHFETYANIINDIRGNDPKNAKWLKANTDKTVKYTDWMKKFNWQKP